jgi:hypothetical protein
MSYTFPVFPPNTSPPTVIYPKIVVNKRWQGNIPESYFLGEYPDIYIDFDEVVAWLKNEETGHNVFEDPPESNWGTRVSMYWGHTDGADGKPPNKDGSPGSPGPWCVAVLNWAYLHFFKNYWGVNCPYNSGSTSVTWYEIAAQEGFLKYYLEDLEAGTFKIRAGDIIVWAKKNPFVEMVDPVTGLKTGLREVNREIAKEMKEATAASRIWAERNRGKAPAAGIVGTRHICMMTGRRFASPAPYSGEVEDPNGEYFEEIQGNTDIDGNSRDGGLVRLKRKSIKRTDIMGWMRFHGRTGICMTTSCIQQSRARKEEQIGARDHTGPLLAFTPPLPVTAGNSIVFNLGVVEPSGLKESILFWRKQGTTVWQQKNTPTKFNGKTIFTIQNDLINPSGGLYSGTIQYYFSFKDNSPAMNTSVFPYPGGWYTVTIVPESGP